VVDRLEEARNDPSVSWVEDPTMLLVADPPWVDSDASEAEGLREAGNRASIDNLGPVGVPVVGPGARCHSLGDDDHGAGLQLASDWSRSRFRSGCMEVLAHTGSVLALGHGRRPADDPGDDSAQADSLYFRRVRPAGDKTVVAERDVDVVNSSCATSRLAACAVEDRHMNPSVDACPQFLYPPSCLRD